MLDPEARGRAAREDRRRRASEARVRRASSSTTTTGACARWPTRSSSEPRPTTASAASRRENLLDDLDHTLKITDGVLRFRIFKVDADSPNMVPPDTEQPMRAPRRRDRGRGRGAPRERARPRPPRTRPRQATAPAAPARPRPPPPPRRRLRGACRRAPAEPAAPKRPPPSAASPPSARSTEPEQGSVRSRRTRSLRLSACRSRRGARTAPMRDLDSERLNIERSENVAATNINRVAITGNLTRDPELRTTPGGTTVCKLRRRGQQPPQGQRDRPVGRQAELLRRHRLRRPGRELRQVPLEGPPGGGRRPPRLERVGGHRTAAASARVEIVADTVQFLGSRDGQPGRRRQRRRQARSPTSPPTPPTSQPASGGRRRRAATTTSRSSSDEHDSTLSPRRARPAGGPVVVLSSRARDAHEAPAQAATRPRREPLMARKQQAPRRRAADAAVASDRNRPRKYTRIQVEKIDYKDLARSAASSPTAARSARVASPASPAATSSSSRWRSSAPASSALLPYVGER